MTELEQKLMSALERLSTQYEQDMKALQLQVTTLTNQVQSLAKQYDTVASLLKEELNE